MDNVTHALAGSLMAAAACQHVQRTGTPLSRPVRTAAWTIGIVMAEFPDIDILYAGDRMGMGTLGYLLHHRGHTHTIVFAILSALVAWGFALLASRDVRARSTARVLLALSLAASLSHVVLDFTNSYGVHPWWPFAGRWFYGDAVFIVEPWFWIVAIPPLVLVVRNVVGRLLLAALLVIILVASWRVELVGAGVAAVLTGGAVLWGAISWRVSAARRVALAIVGWLALEATFFAAAATGRATVRRAEGPRLRDVVLSPSPGNPLCLSAIVVTSEDGRYAATTATVASLPSMYAADSCGPGRSGSALGATASTRAPTAAIRWGGRWEAPVAELQALAAERCDIAAALRFIRVPIWRRAPNGDVTLYDLRYGDGGPSFATVVSRPGVTCDWTVPGWGWPRGDVLLDAE